MYSDTSRGRPAANVKIELFTDDSAIAVDQFITNADGRTDKPLIDTGKLCKGIYELRFHAGDYFRANGANSDDTLFLDVVVIRFGVNTTDQHYHVPLLAFTVRLLNLQR